MILVEPDVAQEKRKTVCERPRFTQREEEHAASAAADRARQRDQLQKPDVNVGKFQPR